MTDFQPISFVDTDAERIERELLLDYQKAIGQALFPGDPRRHFLLQMVPALVALRNSINYTGNSNLLPFAFGSILDALGDRFNVPRLLESSAQVTIRFSLSTIQTSAITIPVGTRVTPDGVLYFATVSTYTINPGETFGDVLAMAMVGGEQYNGFVPGQIRLLVDPIPYVASVVNLDISHGGTDAETDDAYRERQRLAPASFSVAGPRNAYVFWAKSADVGITDVAVTSPGPGIINIYPLLENGALPNKDVLDKVEEAVKDDTRRPLTDLVTVLAPEEATYEISLTYYISSEQSAKEAAIRSAIEGSDGAIYQYEAWQSSKLGRAITPDYLISRLYVAGAYRVVLTVPTYTPLEEFKIAKRIGDLSITYGGLI
ncbi:baseplate assembly protein [Gorillibacterium massiliense]|uniref:baseplate assembly protein n=1 Tax=Gorillibacterium massiliense TaxID=1280390 RepID=UPI0004B50558|nr:baseplate J/gp47 family protein [Gorillibacterium massiliense]